MERFKFHWSKFVLWSSIVVIYSTFIVSSINDSDLGIPCRNNDDCSAINGSVCNSSIAQCQCPEPIPIFVNDTTKNSSYCLKALSLGDKGCIYSEQCNFEHGSCYERSNHIRSCECAPRYREKKGTCQEIGALVPIIVGSVLAGMIVLTLIVYYTISRKNPETS